MNTEPTQELEAQPELAKPATPAPEAKAHGMLAGVFAPLITRTDADVRREQQLGLAQVLHGRPDSALTTAPEGKPSCH